MYAPTFDSLAKEIETQPGQAAYLAWIGDPYTQRVLLACREISRPRPVIPGENTDIAYGRLLGMNEILDVLVSPIGQAANKLRGEMPKATYGAKVEKLDE